MDSREKIKEVQELHSLLAEHSWTAFVGTFDPLTADAVELIGRTRMPGRKLLIVIRPEPDELLTAESRAVLLAGLRSVDAVHVSHTNEWHSLVENGSVPVIEEQDARRRRDEFAALVEARQAASEG